MKIEQKNLFFRLMVFNHVVKQGSFTGAAEQLNLPKSGVSQHISQLEQQLSTQLLIRSTRSLTLTHTGEVLFKRSNELKALMDITLDEVNNINQQPEGELCITSPQALVRPAVLPAINKLSARFPKIRPRFIVDDTSQDLIAQGIDVAVRVGELKDMDLKARKVGEQRNVFIASTDYLAGIEGAGPERDISLDTLAEHPFIATSWQTPTAVNTFTDHHSQQHTIALTPQFEANSAHIAMEMVLMNLGIALLPDIYVASYVAEKKVVPLLPALTASADGIYCVHAYTQRTPLAVKWFTEFMLESLSPAS